MIKLDIANSIMNVHPCSRHTAIQVVDILTERMKQALLEGHRIEIRGFGSFSLHYREARQGRNPKTGDAVELEGKYVPHFKPGKDLRERVNRSIKAVF